MGLGSFAPNSSHDINNYLDDNHGLPNPDGTNNQDEGVVGKFELPKI